MKKNRVPKNFRAIVLLFLCFCSSLAGRAQIINTIAGSGAFGIDSGDGGPATRAIFTSNNDFAIDSRGYIYSADGYDIRKINSAGIISTIAGDTSYSTYWVGNDIPATTAYVSYAVGITIDRYGNIYFSDNELQIIRKIDTSGIISNFAGDTTVCFSYSGGSFGGDGGPASSALFNYPMGITFDSSGNLYIADLANNRIRKVNTAGIVSTIAGCDTATSLGDGGPATAAYLLGPTEVKLDRHGNIYILDRSLVRKINTSGIINTVAGNDTLSGYSGDGGQATNASLDQPDGLVLDDSGNIYIASSNDSPSIRKVNTAGIITRFAGNGISGFSGDGGPAMAAEFRSLGGLCFDDLHNLYLKDYSRIRKITSCLPSIGAISGSSSVCPGSTIALTDTSSGGTWSVSSAGTATINSSGSVTGITPGIDTINYSKTNGCGTTVETDVITVNPLPNAGTITGTTDSVCPGHTISLTDAVTGGSWLSSNTGIATVSAGIVTGVAAGSTTIKYIVTNPCGADTASFSVNVPDHAYCNMGINPTIQQYDNLSIYPNPNKGSFTINLSSGSSEGAHVIITNMLGQKVNELMVKNNQPTEVQLVVPGGVYFVSTIINNTPVMQKIVVE